MRATLTWTDADDVEHIRHIESPDGLSFSFDDIAGADGCLVTFASTRLEGSVAFAVNRMPDGSLLMSEA